MEPSQCLKAARGFISVYDVRNLGKIGKAQPEGESQYYGKQYNVRQYSPANSKQIALRRLGHSRSAGVHSGRQQKQHNARDPRPLSNRPAGSGQGAEISAERATAGSENETCTCPLAPCQTSHIGIVCKYDPRILHALKKLCQDPLSTARQYIALADQDTA